MGRSGHLLTGQAPERGWGGAEGALTPGKVHRVCSLRSDTALSRGDPGVRTRDSSPGFPTSTGTRRAGRGRERQVLAERPFAGACASLASPEPRLLSPPSFRSSSRPTLERGLPQSSLSWSLFSSRLSLWTP